MFGINDVNLSRTVYIVEGPFDSLLLENSIAMVGASISEIPELAGCNVVYVYDNQPRNQPICKQVRDRIHNGDSVVIWPNGIQEKDINDMYLAGYDVNKIVTENTYNGLIADLKFTIWRK